MAAATAANTSGVVNRSEEHTSELQSRRDLVCRLLLEKKKKKSITSALAFAVNWPQHAPAPGQAQRSSACTSASVIFPAALFFLTSTAPSNFTSFPSQEPFAI